MHSPSRERANRARARAAAASHRARAAAGAAAYARPERFPPGSSVLVVAKRGASLRATIVSAAPDGKYTVRFATGDSESGVNAARISFDSSGGDARI